MRRLVALLTIALALLWGQTADAATNYWCLSTVTSGSISTATVPADWTSTNTIYVFSSGGNGVAGSAGHAGGGGGSGGFTFITNQALTPGGSVGYYIGNGVAGAGITDVSSAAWLCNATTLCTGLTTTNVVVGIQGGAVGVASGTAGAGALTTSAKGTPTGGSAGSAGIFADGGGGGGGAPDLLAGTPTAGVGAGAPTSGHGGAGGNSGSGALGGAGATVSTAAQVGANGSGVVADTGALNGCSDQAVGGGGGGGGGTVSTNLSGAAGGGFGGGGSGALPSDTPGAGTQGFILGVYTTAAASASHNLLLMGVGN